MKNSQQKYSQDVLWSKKLANKIYKNQEFRAKFENKYKLMASLGDTMNNMKSLSSVLTASLIACILRIIVGALMVTTSLVENDISDSTYEHAMLRCLGWTQNYTKMIVMIKSLAF